MAWLEHECLVNVFNYMRQSDEYSICLNIEAEKSFQNYNFLNLFFMMTGNVSGGGNDMRSKVIKLNSELLEKKMLVSKLEEELTLLKRRYNRLQDSHRLVK